MKGARKRRQLALPRGWSRAAFLYSGSRQNLQQGKTKKEVISHTTSYHDVPCSAAGRAGAGNGNGSLSTDNPTTNEELA